MTKEPFIAHSELTNEIYIVIGKEKYRVTEQAIKAVVAIKALDQEPQKFKWCTDCREYDQEKHCCHRWSKFIRDTVEEMKQEPILDKIYCTIHPLSIMSTPALEHKAIMQIAEMLEPLCLSESEEE